MRPDFAGVEAMIARIADAEIASHYGKLAAGSIRTKSEPNDLVTLVDEATERALNAALTALAPGAGFIGEESAAADPSVFSAIGGDACWIVDPLDGTRNFVNGVDEFGVIVAYLEHGVTIGGWIHAVPLKSAAVGVRGGGVRFGGAGVDVRPQADGTPHGLRSTGWLPAPSRDRIIANLKANVTSRPGHCSAYAYLKLITGEVDFKLSSRIHPWDHAAGALMLEELGGEVRWLDVGAPYTPQQSVDRALLATAPGRDWDAIARLIGD